MNVWIVNHYAIPPSLGGLVRHYYFSKYLQQKGHQVRIFTSSKIHNMNKNMIDDGALYKEQVIDDIEYTFVRSRDYSGNGLDRITNLINFPFEVQKTMSYFYKMEKPDVIYASSPDLFVVYFALRFGKRHGIPVVVEIRDLWPKSIVEYNNFSEYNPIIQVMYQLEKYIYRKTDKLIFTFAGGKTYIEDRGWQNVIDLQKVHHVNNGVDLEEFEYNKTNYVLNDTDLVNPVNFKVIYVGSIRLVNHLRELVDAAEILKNRGKNNIQILIYGDGTEKEELEAYCISHQLNVKFKGRVEKKYIPYILSKSDLNIVNVKKSNLVRYGVSWNKLFEYMASEKPILCNLPTNFDLIEEYHLGVSHYFTAEDYAAEIQRFAELPHKEYQQYCNNAVSLKLRYDYKNLTDQILEVLESCVNNDNKEEKL